MAALTPYLLFPGTAREALTFYADVFGGTAEVHDFGEFGRDDGPSEAVAHGILTGSPVALYAADAAGDEKPYQAEGMMFSLLGAADPATLRAWFARLSEGGRVVDELQLRPWGDFDGQVVDRFDLHWLIGYKGDAVAGESGQGDPAQ